MPNQNLCDCYAHQYRQTALAEINRNFREADFWTTSESVLDVSSGLPVTRGPSPRCRERLKGRQSCQCVWRA
jgi:hypothetical protein